MNEWIAHGIERPGAEINIVCFPFAGGTASNYAKWKNCLSDKYSVYPMLYPAREKRAKDKMYDSVEEMTEEIARANRYLFEKKFIMFGQCTGSIIAYEVCRYIKNLYGREPMLFIASGSSSPGTRIVDRDALKLNNEDWLKFLVDVGRITGEAAGMPMFLEYYFPILKADFSLLAKYDYPGDLVLDCPLLTLQGDEDTLTPEDEIQKWESYVTGCHRNQVVHGSHYFLESCSEVICKEIEYTVKEMEQHVD